MKYGYGLWTMVVISLMKLTTCVAAATAESAPATLQTGEVVCRIESERQSIEAYTPLLVRVRLDNLSDHSLWLKQPFASSYGTVWVQIRKARSDDWERVYTGFSGASSVYMMSDIEVVPGDSLSEHILLFFGTRGGPKGGRPQTPFLFSKPGRYELRALVAHRHGSLVSPALSLQVLSARQELSAFAQTLEEDSSMDEVQRAFSKEDKARRRLVSQLASICAGGCTPEALELLETHFQGTTASNHLLSYCRASVLLDSRESEEQDRGIAILETLRNSRAPDNAIWSSLASDRLALALVEAGKYAEATRLLDERTGSMSEWTRMAKALLSESTSQPAEDKSDKQSTPAGKGAAVVVPRPGSTGSR